MPLSRRCADAVSGFALLAVTVALLTVSMPGLARPSRAATTARYLVTIIRNPGASQRVRVLGVNRAGDIFGTAANGIAANATAANGFLLPAGSTTMRFLGAPGAGGPGSTTSTVNPVGINNSADVVGFGLAGRDVPLEWPGSANPTGLADLGGLAGQPGQATGINDSNEVVGFTETDSEIPYLVKDGRVSALPVLPDGGLDARPYAVSGSGVIVGDGNTRTTNSMAVQWRDGRITRLAEEPRTLLSQAFAVNAAGVAVGDAILSTDGRAHATRWANGTVTDLRPPGTGGGDAMANAINSGGVIVGSGGNGHGFVYRDGTATDLNTLIAPTAGLTLTDAVGINDQGIIVGDATLNGQAVGYELTPRRPRRRARVDE
jgi:probable HAF family extracellular repeat protein